MRKSLPLPSPQRIFKWDQVFGGRITHSLSDSTLLLHLTHSYRFAAAIIDSPHTCRRLT